MINNEHFLKWFDNNYEVTASGKIKVIGKNRYKTNADLHHDYVALLETACLPTDDITISDVVNAIANKMPEQMPKSEDEEVEWVNSVLTAPNCKYVISRTGKEIEYVGNIDDDCRLGADQNDVLNYLTLQNAHGPKYQTGVLKAALSMFMKNAEYNVLRKMTNDIKYDATKLDFLDEYLNFLYDYWQFKESRDIFKMMMKQWMWCVKRKLFNKSVQWHIWLNFYGATGFGKTQFVERMTKHFVEFTGKGNGIEVFNDIGREYKKFANNYILFFDELAKQNATGTADAALTTDLLSAIKQSITGDYLDVRVMGGQEQVRAKIRYTPISCANTHLYDIIFDETSMRRFFEFNIERKTMPTDADHDALNAMLAKSSDAWKAINENDDDGYYNPNSELGLQVIEIQKHYLPTRTTVNAWINHTHVVAGKHKAENFYQEYKNWCKEHGYNARNLDGYLSILATRFGKQSDGNILVDYDTADIADPESFDALNADKKRFTGVTI